MTRDRTGGTMKYQRTRAEQKALLIDDGCEFFRGEPKHRYVGIYGDRRIKRMLRGALRWRVLPYPKRKTLGETTAGSDVTPFRHCDAIPPAFTGNKESRKTAA